MPANCAARVAKRGVLTGKTGVVVEIRSRIDEGWSRNSKWSATQQFSQRAEVKNNTEANPLNW
jgi:hypothetical protein